MTAAQEPEAIPHGRAWIARSLTGLLIAVLAFLALAPASVLQPPLNRVLRFLELPYETVLWIEANMGLFTHFLGVFLLAVSVERCRLGFLAGRIRLSVALLAVMILLETAHAMVGRGFSIVDLLVGAAGLLAAMPWIAPEPGRD